MPNAANPAIDELINPVNGVIDEFTQVRVVNGTNQPIRWQYASRWFEIPGQNDPQGRRPHTVMPYHAMVLYCGDPRTFDVQGDMRQRDRTNEFKRLCTLYGVYDNIDNKTPQTHFPLVQVYTLNDTRLITVLDDPTGETTSDEASNLTALEQMQRLVAAQGEALRQYQAQLAEMSRQMNGGFDESDNPSRMNADLLRDDTGNPQFVPDPVVPTNDELAAQWEASQAARADLTAQEEVANTTTLTPSPDEVVDGEIEAAFQARQNAARKPGEIPGTEPDKVASSLPPAPQAPPVSPFGR